MSAHARTLLSHLHRLTASAATDAALLARWIEQRDQQAFASLMARHGPMVLGVCRRLLGEVHEAEDVFQAVFLVLARRASRVRQPEALAGFLHTIAVRLARKARAAKCRLWKHTNAEVPEPVDPRPHPLDILSGRELLALLDDEIARLRERYRLPLLFCLLQGRTVEEAARQLGWSVGSLRGRLNRGRERLRRRLLRRGLDLSVGTVALLTPAAVSDKLLGESLRHLNGPVPAAIGALADGMLPALKQKIIGPTLIIVTAVGLGAGLSLRSNPEPQPPIASRPAAPPAQAEIEPRRDRYGDPLPPGAVARLGTLRFRVDAYEVNHLTFSPDGKTLAVAPWNFWSPRGPCLFDVTTGKQTSVIPPPSQNTASLGSSLYTADGKRLVTAAELQLQGSRKLVLQTWDVSSGRKLAESELETAGLLWWGCTADGQSRLARLCKGEISLDELSTGAKRRFPAKDLPDPKSGFPCWCDVGKNLLVAGNNMGLIHIWDILNGVERCSLQVSGELDHGPVLSQDERWLATLSRDAGGKKTVQVWEVRTGRLQHTVAADQRFLHGLAFTPDSKTLTTVGSSEIRFWHPESGREQCRTKGEVRSFASTVAFTPDSKTMATAERYGGAIHLWDVETGEHKPQPEGHTNRPRQPSFSPDGKRVATGCEMDATIWIWELATGEPVIHIHRDEWVSNCAFSSDGRTVYSCCGDKLYFRDAATGHESCVLKVEDPDRPEVRQSGLNLYLSDDRTRLIVLGSDGTHRETLLTGWNISTRRQLFNRRRVLDASGIAVSPNGRTLAVADPGTGGRGSMGAGPMYLEALGTGERLLTFPGFEGQRWPLVFSTDGRLLVSFNNSPPPGNLGKTLRVWEVLTASELQILPATDGNARSAFSPDGHLLAVTSAAGEILLWDLRRGKEFRRLKDLDAQITSLAFSPDGRRLVSGLSDSTLLVWDVGARSAVPDVKLGSDAEAKAWDDLASANAPRAFHARSTLASAPEEAISLLTKQLHPTSPTDPQRRRLLTDLESEHFDMREKAQKDLEELGDLAEPALRQTLEKKPTLEVRRRVQAVLEGLRGPVTRPELLQSLRAVAVLEDIDNHEARRLLEELANGAPEARLTREAKSSLRRLDLRNLSALNP
jgi:RNA polymerase sigma factor (sigma-70 family)